MSFFHCTPFLHLRKMSAPGSSHDTRFPSGTQHLKRLVDCWQSRSVARTRLVGDLVLNPTAVTLYHNHANSESEAVACDSTCAAKHWPAVVRGYNGEESS